MTKTDVDLWRYDKGSPPYLMSHYQSCHGLGFTITFSKNISTMAFEIEKKHSHNNDFIGYFPALYEVRN